MSEKEFKKKQIEKCYMVIHIIKRPVKLKNDGIIEIKEFYSIIGIDLFGKRTVINYGININESRDWIAVFEDMRSRGCEDILYITIEADKAFTRGLKVYFPNTIIVSSIFQKIQNIGKYFTLSYDEPLPKMVHDLFLSESKENYEKEYKILIERYSDNKFIRSVIEKNMDGVIDVYNHDKELRRVLYNYYFLRQYNTRISKQVNKIEVSATLDDIINLLINEIEFIEEHRCFSKEQSRCLLNLLMKLHGERIEKYL